MLIAIRHKKSRPAWLALIAVIAAGATVVATLATVVIGSVVQARRAADPAAAVALAARPDGRTGVRVTVPAAAQESPDALAARAEAVSRAAAAQAVTASAPLASASPGTPASPGPARSATGATDAPASVTTASRMEKTTANAPAESLLAADDGAHPAVPTHRFLPSRASGHAGARHAGNNALGNMARGEGSLRADITRYNAERGNAGERRRALTLHAASVPGVRSLWDEVPRPLSELYRN